MRNDVQGCNVLLFNCPSDFGRGGSGIEDNRLVWLNQLRGRPADTGFFLVTQRLFHI
jgi:hypothetical protein